MMSSAFVKVTCNKCHDYDEDIELTALAHNGSWDERNVARSLQRSGWRIDGEDTHVCPNCLEDEAEEKDSTT